MNIIEKKLVTLNQDLAGQEIGIPVYRIRPDHAQTLPIVYIQSAVHAAEMQGSAVIFKLIKALQALTLHCEVVLVPNCNPFGRTQRAGEYLQGRFDATTGNNWNRFYHYDKGLVSRFISSTQLSPTMDAKWIANAFRAALKQSIDDKFDAKWGVNTAQFLNTTLQKMATDADYVFDLHTGPSSTRHLYAPSFLADQAKLFNIENIISIPAEFAGALDEASFTPWCDLASTLMEHGINFDYRVKAFTVELGSQENISLEQAEHDAAGILNYMLHQGLVSDLTPLALTDIVTTPLNKYRTLFSKHAGMVEYLAKAGDKVCQGQVIARVLNSLEFDNEQGLVEVKSPADGIVILHYPSAAVQVGTQLYKIALTE